MITAEIKINGKRLHYISAVNKGKTKGKKDSKKHEWRNYTLNCGCKLVSDRKKGALCMLIQMAGHAQMCPIITS